MKLHRLLIYSLLFLAALAFSGCSGHHGVLTSGQGTVHNTPVVVAPAPSPGPGHGPPPWAPAQGRRAKYTYRYYPSLSVYFEPVRNVWFYLEGGSWRVSANLPGAIVLGSSTYVSLHMDTDKPYHHHAEVVKKHPSKHHEKKGKGKNKGKNKWKHKGG